MVAKLIPNQQDGVRFASTPQNIWAQTRKVAVLPCKQNDGERYPMGPPSWFVFGSNGTRYVPQSSSTLETSSGSPERTRFGGVSRDGH